MINVDKIMEYEAGEMDPDAMIEMFSELIKDGTAWTLQGHYGRTAMGLIKGGYLSRDGEILRHYYEEE